MQGIKRKLLQNKQLCPNNLGITTTKLLYKWWKHITVQDQTLAVLLGLGLPKLLYI